ncbi:hypothetical protein F2P81_002352 [Scophthalmus maximus]|uniref:Uncharacterized protein n=1 Tax=Scophthalmus maximus TaxID=52904 RepID=A0A6A4TII3_SCOMX|nr:hypothetical protein F2P81_002352 [Scophthalmus maximus]
MVFGSQGEITAQAGIACDRVHRGIALYPFARKTLQQGESQVNASRQQTPGPYCTAALSVKKTPGGCFTGGPRTLGPLRQQSLDAVTRRVTLGTHQREKERNTLTMNSEPLIHPVLSHGQRKSDISSSGIHTPVCLFELKGCGRKLGNGTQLRATETLDGFPSRRSAEERADQEHTQQENRKRYKQNE